jgi:hypothetical protein
MMASLDDHDLVVMVPAAMPATVFAELSTRTAHFRSVAMESTIAADADIDIFRTGNTWDRDAQRGNRRQ